MRFELALSLLLTCGAASAAADNDDRASSAPGCPISVSLDIKDPGRTLPAAFSGLSYEMALVLPGSNGAYFFGPENKALVGMFQTLGIKSLRVGGNTAERDTVAIPGKADIDSLFAFAEAAGVEVIYTLPLGRSHPQASAELAKYVMEHYRSNLTCFCLGNEPEKLAKDYASYREMFARPIEVITAATNAPEAKFCGPSTTHKNAAWARQFAGDFGNDRRIALVTQHEYPARSGLSVVSAAAGCDTLLSAGLIGTYETLHKEFVPAVLTNGQRFRLEEANSFSNGGAPDVSDAFASALWGLDYLFWWAAHGAEGINFHSGGYVAGTRPRVPMRYAVFWNSDDGFAAHPLAYALKAFELAGTGRLVTANLTSNPAHLNLTAYCVLGQDGSLRVILINKEYGPNARAAQVTLDSGNTCRGGQVMFLTAPGGDVQAKSGVTLGGAAIGSNGAWKGSWKPLTTPNENGQFNVSLPAAAAAIVRLTAQQAF